MFLGYFPGGCSCEFQNYTYNKTSVMSLGYFPGRCSCEFQNACKANMTSLGNFPVGCKQIFKFQIYFRLNNKMSGKSIQCRRVMWLMLQQLKMDNSSISSLFFIWVTNYLQFTMPPFTYFTSLVFAFWNSHEHLPGKYTRNITLVLL